MRCRGPGCSSMAGGFLSELGPFYATKGNNLQRNEFAWNRVRHSLNDCDANSQ